jgi:hypothetical protein
LVTDAATTFPIKFDAVAFRKLATIFEAVGNQDVWGRDRVVKHQRDLFRVPYFLRKWEATRDSESAVQQHGLVYLDGDNIPNRHELFICCFCKDLLDHRHAHGMLLFQIAHALEQRANAASQRQLHELGG